MLGKVLASGGAGEGERRGFHLLSQGYDPLAYGKLNEVNLIVDV